MPQTTRTAHALEVRADALESDAGAILNLFDELGERMVALADVEDFPQIETFLRARIKEVTMARANLAELAQDRTSTLRARARGRGGSTPQQPATPAGDEGE